MAPKTFHYRYQVVGNGVFPIDMLRYDRAWPRTEADSSRIVQWRGIGGGLAAVAIEGLSHPTDARWRSFGWRVNSEVEKVAS